MIQLQSQNVKKIEKEGSIAFFGARSTMLKMVEVLEMLDNI